MQSSRPKIEKTAKPGYNWKKFEEYLCIQQFAFASFLIKSWRGATFMDIVNNLFVNLITGIIVFIFTVILNKVITKLPGRRLWGIKDPGSLKIIAATSTSTNTGVYNRPATGIGQVKAATYVTNSLNKTYKRFDNENIYLSIEQVDLMLNNDIILLGGPKNNRFTKQLFERDEITKYVYQQEGRICWGLGESETAVEYCGEESDNKIKKDYGIILKIENPFSHKDHTLVLFSGSHTYGTIAAAKYYTEVKAKDFRFLKSSMSSYYAIVSCEVQNDSIFNIKLEKELIIN